MAKYDEREIIEKQREESRRINDDFAGNTTIKLEKIDLTKIQTVDATELYSAPKQWNYFERLSDDKLYELMDSISDNGLISPVILWKIDRSELFKEGDADMYGFYGQDYMILSGHNRVQAYLNLYDSNKKEKYETIPAFIFEKISEFQARNIIIDSNYAQRDLSTKEKAKSIIDKYHVYEKEKIRKGKIDEFIAADLNISPRMVFNYKKLANLNDGIKGMVYNNEIPLTAAIKLANVSIHTQDWLYDNNKEYIIKKILDKIKPDATKKDIERIIESYKKDLSNEIISVTTKIPKELEEKFKNMCSQWLYNNTKRN